MSNFEEAYKSLNKAQKLAVDTLEGPLLVVAGPGTGKTQLLSMRVANILKSTDTRPINVLCLTYTNKAAINMKQRIIQLAGPESSKLPVKTFHSFAGEIMNLYPDSFWNAARLSVAPESVQIEILQSTLASLHFDNPLALKFSGQYTLINDIKQAIGLAKDAGLTPSKLRSLIKFNIAYIDTIESQIVEFLDSKLSIKTLDKLLIKFESLPKQDIDEIVYPLISLQTIIQESLMQAVEIDLQLSKTSNTSLWKKRWVQTIGGAKGMFAERKRNIWWLELCEVYELYNDAMHQRGFYDYSDMLVEVISKLENDPEILADIQENYSYVLIDEFQDTTMAQLRLAHLVSDHYSSAGSPNLMVVGDDDQTIFKFSGAELNNMLGFKRRYAKANVIVLTNNYRSTQKVLDAAKRVIEQTETRLVDIDRSLNKTLLAVNPPSLSSEINTLGYSSRELQFSSIAKDIKSKYSADRSMVVLARGHDSLLKMASILNQLNIPISYEFRNNILKQDLVQQIYLISKLVIAIREGNSLVCNSLVHRIIRHPMWGISPYVLWELALSNSKNHDWFSSLINSKDNNIKNIGDWLSCLAYEISDLPLAINLEFMIGLRENSIFKSPIKSYFLTDSGDRTKLYFDNISAIQLLRSLVHEFAKNSEPTIEDLVNYVEINSENNIIIADESPFITGKHAVQLMTVYKSKGLEFDDVYVIDAVEDIWKPRSGKRQLPANLPLQPAGDDLDDYIRLMYVAITRAKSNVTISSYYQNHVGKEVSISPIVQGAFDIQLISENRTQILTEVLEENLRWPDLSGGDEKAMLQSKLETYSLSVTHLLNFLDIEKGGPKYFKERNLLTLPETKSINLAYGTAMHAALETAQGLVNKSKFNLDKIINDFKTSLKAQQILDNDYKRFSKRGEDVLRKLFSEYQYKLPLGSKTEQNLKAVRIGEASIRGKLDRVDFLENSIRIIDYKTGNPLSSFDTKSKTDMMKAHRQKLQLIFYAILAKEHPSFSKYNNIDGEMVYLEATTFNSLTRSYASTAEDIDRLRILIQSVHQHIMRLDFPDISKYSSDLTGMIAFEDYLINNFDK